MRRLATLAWTVLGVVLTAGVASAHPLDATAFTAPVPLPLLYLGGGATVAVTAGWLGWGDRVALQDSDRTVAHVPPGLARPARLAARAAFLALFLGALAHGLVGPSTPAENLATVVVWPLVLKGVALVAVVAGSPWRALSPWETVYDGLAALEGDRLAVLGDYPARLGAWPAFAGFVLGVGVLENLTVATRSPTTTVAVAGTYAALLVAGGVAFGREWFARADALGVLFGILSRVAVLRVERTNDGGYRVMVRPPWAGCTDPVADASIVAFVVATVYTVSFDGFTATATFRDLLFATRDILSVGVADLALYVAGLGVFLASFLLAAGAAARFGSPTTADSPGTALAFAGTVVPIAAAYEVAHNYPYVAANLGQAFALGRDLALGADGGPVVLLAWLPVAGFWASQVGLIVVGHLVGVVAAHRVAAARTDSAAAARRAHAPLVVVMVAYTVLSLWIVSQPLVA